MKKLTEIIGDLRALERDLFNMESKSFTVEAKQMLLNKASEILVAIALLETEHAEPVATPWPAEAHVVVSPIQPSITEIKQVIIEKMPVEEAAIVEEKVRQEPIGETKKEVRAPSHLNTTKDPVTDSDIAHVPAKGGATLQELAAQKQRLGSINDKMGHTGDKNLSDKLKGKPIQNLVTGIPLNDRVLIIRSLFKGDHAGFENTIRQLDRFTNKEDAMQYVQDILMPTYHWNTQDEIFNSLIVLIERRYLA